MESAANLKGHLLCVLPFKEPKEITSRIQDAYPLLKITYIHPTTEKIFDHNQGISDELWKDVTFLATLSALPPLPDLVPNLEFIQLWSAGTNHIAEHPIYTDTKISLATVSGIHGLPIAEWVLMTLLVSSRCYDLTHSWQQISQWGSGGRLDPRLQTVHDMAGMRLGVLGYGSIGRQVARVCRAMGMEVVAFTASPRKTANSKRDHGYIIPGTGDPDGSIPTTWYSGLDKNSLHKFLADDIDVLVLSLPLTSKTKKLIGKDELNILTKRNAFISNISRGQILDQDELVIQLRAFHEDGNGVFRKGRKGLRGAALDVTDPEPLPEGHSLFTTPNCIVTPHISGLGAAYVHRAFEVLETNLQRWSTGGEYLVNLVDRVKGY